MVRWHHRLDELEFDQALGVGDGQGSLVCRSPRGRKESDRTERRTELMMNQAMIEHNTHLPPANIKESVSKAFECKRNVQKKRLDIVQIMLQG